MCQIFSMDRSAGLSHVNKERKLGAPQRGRVERRPSGVCRKKKSSKKKRALQKRPPQPPKRLRPVLRPTGADVPQAPQNSTQFIMDDHEGSQDFYNFDASYEEDVQQTPSITNNFAVTDFENVFQHAHEDSLLNSSVDDLKSDIVSLEHKCAKLRQAIAARPSVLLHTLQSLLIDLQEENKKLKQELNETVSEHSSSHTSDSSSDSDSSDSSMSGSSSDSECSDIDCKQCLAKRNKDNSTSKSPNSALQAA